MNRPHEENKKNLKVVYDWMSCESEPSVCSDVCVIYRCVSVYELEKNNVCKVQDRYMFT